MSAFIIFNEATGRIIQNCQANSIEAASTAAGEGQQVLAVTAPVDNSAFYVAAGELVTMPARPTGHHTWDWPTKAWHDPRTLQDLRAAKWAGIKTLRDALEATSFPYLDKVIDSDARSVQRITTAVQSADAAQRAGVAFAIDWTCADDSTLSLDGLAMQGMPVALAQYADALHQHARSLRAQIEAAATPEEIHLITWDTNA